MKPALRRLLWFVAIAGTAGAVVWVDRGDEDLADAAVPLRHAVSRDERQAGANGSAPILQLELLEARAFEDMKADLFASHSWYVPPPVVAQKPKAPALPFSYSGRLIEEGRTTVFLVQQDRNQAVQQGDLIDKTWRVDSIGDTRMSLTYLPLNESQTLTLGAAP